MENQLKIAAGQGKLNQVKKLVRQGINPGADNNRALVYAARFNKSSIVRYLLKQKGVDPTINNLEPLELAIKNNSLESVYWLLQDDRVIKQIQNMSLSRNLDDLLAGAAKINPQILEMLLHIKSVKPYMKRHIDYFTPFLLEYNGLSSSQMKTGLNDYLIIAAANNFVNVADILLELSVVDPTFENSLAIRAAKKLGGVDVIKLFNKL